MADERSARRFFVLLLALTTLALALVVRPLASALFMAAVLAGMLAPFVPKLALAKTGKGIPYFAPACPFNIIGINTIVFPMKIVNMACHQFMPPPIRELASI